MQHRKTCNHSRAPALRDLSFMKTQLEVDFGKEAKEIEKKLGL
jgi:hypothetical protein